MDLYLRKSEHGQQSPDIYRVILKDDGDEVEIGSISVQHSAGASSACKKPATSSPCGLPDGGGLLHFTSGNRLSCLRRKARTPLRSSPWRVWAFPT